MNKFKHRINKLQLGNLFPGNLKSILHYLYDRLNKLESKINTSNGNNLQATGLEKITENGKSGWRLFGKDANKYGNIGENAVDISEQNTNNSNKGATGDNSYAEGLNSTASGWLSHVEGYANIASGNSSHAEGNYTQATGRSSHTEGYRTKATGHYSHAEGYGTQATRYGAHAEGSGTQSRSYYSHAEGSYTKALQSSSHAEGYGTEARSFYSHAEGYRTIAKNRGSHACGMYNKGTSTQTIFEAGIGTSNSNRKNGFEIYKNGVVTAPEASPSEIKFNSKALITREYLDYFKYTFLSNGATPSSSSASGVKGEIRKDANYIYICVDTNEWIRLNIANW